MSSKLLRNGSSRRWRALRRLVRAQLVMAGSLPCTICGEPVGAQDPMHVDHKVPLVAGGTDRWDNLGPAHPSCNCRAHANYRRHMVARSSREW